MVSELKRKSIKITYDKSLEQECSIGVSKIGGKPDLPKDFGWFYYEGESPNNVVKNRPLAFFSTN